MNEVTLPMSLSVNRRMVTRQTGEARLVASGWPRSLNIWPIRLAFQILLTNRSQDSAWLQPDDILVQRVTLPIRLPWHHDGNRKSLSIDLMMRLSLPAVSANQACRHGTNTNFLRESAGHCAGQRRNQSTDIDALHFRRLRPRATGNRAASEDCCAGRPAGWLAGALK